MGNCWASSYQVRIAQQALRITEKRGHGFAGKVSRLHGKLEGYVSPNLPSYLLALVLAAMMCLQVEAVI